MSSVNNAAREVRIRFQRPGKPDQVFIEGFLSDDGRVLRTRTLVPPEYAEPWSLRYVKMGLIEAGQQIYAAAKRLSYQQPFTILELLDAQEQTLGYYCDICSPLHREGEGFTLTDLFLDVWVWPDGRLRVLDREEFEHAATSGVISESQVGLANDTVARLEAELANGQFPASYL